MNLIQTVEAQQISDEQFIQNYLWNGWAFIPMEVIIVFTILAFILWTMLWSFFYVVYYRTKNKIKWIVNWRSFCPHCKTQLTSLDLIPLFSYIFLRWKCRHCKKPIWSKYFIVELVCGLILWWIVFSLLYFGLLDKILYEFKFYSLK